LEIIEKEVILPKYGEVLIKVEASPINPSDYLFLKGILNN
jgi:NADPH:quinone reductase-like Zn-dependent oxidoreductase